jgi:hypothetical protein
LVAFVEIFLVDFEMDERGGVHDCGARGLVDRFALHGPALPRERADSATQPTARDGRSAVTK